LSCELNINHCVHLRQFTCEEIFRGKAEYCYPLACGVFATLGLPHHRHSCCYWCCRPASSYRRKPRRSGSRRSRSRRTGKGGMPDIRVEVDMMVEEGNKVAAFGAFVGTFTGEMMGMAGQGQQVRMPFADLLE
jgi:hypothetical protein